MKKGNLIFIVGGLGLLYYFFTRKKNAIPVIKPLIPSTTNVPTQPKVEPYVLLSSWFI